VALDHSIVEARLAAVKAPSVTVVGALDPDFSDPAAELDWITGAIDTRGILVPDAGHYPQHQAADVVVPAVLELLAGLPALPAPSTADAAVQGRDGGARA
jgi:pimeloyl-ACP methyl ester carboxylesterase